MVVRGRMVYDLEALIGEMERFPFKNLLSFEFELAGVDATEGVESSLENSFGRLVAKF